MVIDTDVLIRFFTNDDPVKAEKFQKALELKQKFILTDVTFAEVYWTLKSFYGFDKAKILNAMETLINTPCIKSNRILMQKTIEILQNKNISFIDAYTASFALKHEQGKIASFDRGFDKIDGIKRVEI